MIQIDQALCTSCGRCVKICETRDIKMTALGAESLHKDCSQCGHCVAVCPTYAIRLTGYDSDEIKEYSFDEFHIDPETLLNFMKFRRSTRAFLPRKVEKDKIELILEAGRYSPTACNYQNLRYVIVENDQSGIPDLLWTGAAAYAQRDGDDYLLSRYKEYLDSERSSDALLYHCSHLIFILAPGENDACIASSRMELMANALGLGALYLGYCKLAVEASKILQNYLQEDADHKTQVVLAVGYPDVQWQRTVPRKPLRTVWK
jgi:nitroreductase/NAD-dependent dihydropyrimidine dehydrogenase PreA subunit